MDAVLFSASCGEVESIFLPFESGLLVDSGVCAVALDFTGLVCISVLEPCYCHVN